MALGRLSELAPWVASGDPPLVDLARLLAAHEKFQDSCTREVGQLLRVLASSVARGIVGEIGAGCGVGAAWIVSGLRSSVPFVTVDADERRARLVQELFEKRANVRVIRGDWRELLAYGPFSLLFVDVKNAKEDEPQAVVDALATGGIAVLDDLTPRHVWTSEQRERWAVDPVRVLWLEHPGLVATEIMVRPDHAVIVAARK